MNSFVLAFPLTVAQDEPFVVTPNVSVEKDTASLIVPGCTLMSEKCCRLDYGQHGYP